MRISDWSSDVCSSDLLYGQGAIWQAKHRPSTARWHRHRIETQPMLRPKRAPAHHVPLVRRPLAGFYCMSSCPPPGYSRRVKAEAFVSFPEIYLKVSSSKSVVEGMGGAVT